MRLAAVRPADPALRIPVPGTSSHLAAGRVVDVESPWWSSLITAGSVVECDPAEEPRES